MKKKSADGADIITLGVWDLDQGLYRYYSYSTPNQYRISVQFSVSILRT